MARLGSDQLCSDPSSVDVSIVSERSCEKSSDLGFLGRIFPADCNEVTLITFDGGSRDWEMDGNDGCGTDNCGFGCGGDTGSDGAKGTDGFASNLLTGETGGNVRLASFPLICGAEGLNSTELREAISPRISCIASAASRARSSASSWIAFCWANYTIKN